MDGRIKEDRGEKETMLSLDQREAYHAELQGTPGKWLRPGMHIENDGILLQISWTLSGLVHAQLRV